jgi:chitin disaccharide deacetylase
MKLILCADDFGQSEAIDQAITQLIEMDRLSATSCMTLSPRWAQAAKKLTPNIRKKAALGLHLDFTLFGDAISHPKLVLMCLARQLSTTKIKLSINQQLDAFETAIGSMPDYVDGHQHVHQLPQIREALLEILLTRYGDNLPWLRIAKPPLADGFKGLIIRGLGSRALEKKAKAQGFMCSGDLLGAYGFNGSSDDYLDRFQGWLKEIRSDTATPVLMCHPAVDMPFNTDDGIYPARVIEFGVLASDAIAKELNRFNLAKSPSG